MNRSSQVIILGSGIGGSLVANILARHGIGVIIVDAGTHPRFAVGESTIPHMSQLLSLTGREFDVPEFELLGLKSPKGIREAIGPTCGIKRTFGFAYHRFGCEHDPREANQFGNVWRDENHFFRQDIDAFLVHSAVKYGATILQDVRVKELDISMEKGVELKTEKGDTIRGEFLIDATGYRSVVTDKLSLREKPSRLVTHTRTLFSHMIDVTPFEQVVTNHLSVPWHQGTLHQVFERGWIWVIPFNNHSDSTNPLISVGLQLDPRYYPDSPLEPEQEFFEFLERLPSVKKQFERAKTVRPWVRTPRLQYSSTKAVGPRFVLTAHAAGFIDPLYSRGMINTVEVTRAICKALIPACKEKDFSEERFEHIETILRRTLDFHDRIVNASLISWKEYEVWNAFMRVWAIGTGCIESNLGSVLLMGEQSPFRRVKNPLGYEFEDPGYHDFFERCYAIVLRYEAGTLEGSQTADLLWQEIKNYAFKMKLPTGTEDHVWAIKNPRSRDLHMGKPGLQERWAMHKDDPHLT